MFNRGTYHRIQYIQLLVSVDQYRDLDYQTNDEWMVNLEGHLLMPTNSPELHFLESKVH